MTEDLIGALVAHFRIRSELGRGGMGVVYEARDEKLGRTVALKMLPVAPERDDTRAARFLREARAAAAITHPAIATVYEIGESDGRLFIAMECISGKTLRDVISAEALETGQALAIARDIASALSKAHTAGIVHRDLKPENVMLSSDGGVKILDFGIAKALDDEAQTDGHANWTTRDGMILGTPGYMSPEQAAGKKCDQRADVFAFGVLLFEMLTGQTPFSGDTPIEQLASVLKDVPTPLPNSTELPEDVRELVNRCLEKAPEKRPRDGAELKEILGRHSAGGRVVLSALSTRVDPLARTLSTPDAARTPSAVPRPDLALAATILEPSALATDQAVVTAPAASTRGLPAWFRWVVVALAIILVGGLAWTRVGDSSQSGESRATATAYPEATRSAPSARTAPVSDLPPVWPCEDEMDAGFDRECSSGFVAWCDPKGERVGCCAKGLVPTGRDGVCGCPPGGAEADTPAAASCPVADAGPRLAAEVLQAKVRARYKDFRACYEMALTKHGRTEGKVAFGLRIAPDGRVFSVCINESPFTDGAARACMLDVWKKMRFPTPSGSGGVTVVYPLTFSPG